MRSSHNLARFAATIFLTSLASFLLFSASNASSFAWVQRDSGYACFAEDGDQQGDADYEYSSGAIKNEDATNDLYLACNLHNSRTDTYTARNAFRIRVRDNNLGDYVFCNVYRRKMASGGATSEVDWDYDSSYQNPDNTRYYDNLDFCLYDAGQGDHSEYFYYARCNLPEEDSGYRSMIFAVEGIADAACY